MTQLIVVTGPPGAGKSTVAALVADQLPVSALVRGDDFFAFLRRGARAPWLPESDAQNRAVTQAAAAATGHFARHCDVVYDGVVGPWFLPAFLAHSGVERTTYVVLLPPLAVCLERVATRLEHGFGDRAAAEHMWREFDDAALDARYVVRDVTSPEAVAREVLGRARAGTAVPPPTGVG